MVTANFAAIAGLSNCCRACCCVLFLPTVVGLVLCLQGCVLGAIGSGPFWSSSHFEMPVTYSYLTALSLAMVMVTFVLLREDKQAQKALANRQYIEHTPVYEDDQQQCSSR